MDIYTKAFFANFSVLAAFLVGNMIMGGFNYFGDKILQKYYPALIQVWALATLVTTPPYLIYLIVTW